MNKFEELGIGKELLKTVKDLGFIEPTPIQEQTIPLVLKGKDVIGQAATGSGKTLAFGSQAIMRSQPGKGIQTLIMAPTRELAEQVAGEIRKFSEGYDLEVVDIYGGVAINPQVRKLEKAEIVVGTPGRIIDHLTRRTMDLSHVNVLVLDEADRMVDMGFLPDVERIMRDCPKKKQVLLFSATMSPDINYVSEKYMVHPKLVSVESYVDPSKLKQIYYDVQTNEKFSLFLHLISHDKTNLAMVFCNTRANVEHVIENLNKNGVNAVGIHGGMNQAKRSKTMEDFYKEHNRILVCTDVAARGLDIKGVTHVYNYDVPAKSNEYIHRIGRTARAGKEGEAITIVTSKDYDNFRRVLDDDSLKIEKEETPEFKKVFVNFSRREERGFGGGARGRGGSRYGAYGTGGPRRDSRRDSRGGFGGDNRGSRSFGRRDSGSSGRGDSREGRRDSRGRSFGNRDGGKRDSGYGGRQGRDTRGSRNGGGRSFGGSRARPDTRRDSSQRDSRGNFGGDNRGSRSFGRRDSGSSGRGDSRGRSFGNRDGGKREGNNSGGRSFGNRSSEGRRDSRSKKNFGKRR